MQILKGKQSKSRRIMIYGENGIGKSTWASKMPNPVVFDLECGSGDIDVDKTAKLSTIEEFNAAMIWAYSTDYQTIIVDSADWLEKIIVSDVISKSGKSTIGEIGYGKGYQTIVRKWQEIMPGLNALWNQNRHIVFTAHAQVEKFSNPGGDSYNYWSPAIEMKYSDCLLQWVDEILYAHTKVMTIQKDEGFNQKRSIAVGGKERILTTVESAHEVAKNRLNLPEELPLDFEKGFGQYLPKVTLNLGNINQLVTNGSSKT